MADVLALPADADAAVVLAEIRLATVWNVRGDPSRTPFVAAAASVLGLPLPLTPNTCANDARGALLWLGPRSWLRVTGDVARDDLDAARAALNDAGGALFDVSASYVGWTVSGAAAARVLNRMCPLDLHPRAFAAGRCAQSLLGHVNALFCQPDESATFLVMVARSLAADAWRDLCGAAATDGYRVAAAGPFGFAMRVG